MSLSSASTRPGAEGATRPSKPDRIRRIRQELKHGPAFEVATDRESVNLQGPDNSRTTVQWSELRQILIVTTDEGPRLTDVFIFLEGADSVLVIPQDARGNEGLVALLVNIVDFDLRAFTRAMGSAEDAEFECWRGSKVEFRLESNQ